MRVIWNCDECGAEDSVAEVPGMEHYQCMDCDMIFNDISEFAIVEKKEALEWRDPVTDKVYQPGDIIPERHTKDGSYYNEDVIVVHCPGFPGGIVEAGNGVELPLPRVEPTDAYFVGPASAAWAWQYRQGQYLMHLSTQRRMGDMIE